MNETFFKNRKIDKDRILAFGFIESPDGYFWSSSLLNGLFWLTVLISHDGKVSTQVIDSISQEEYVLFRVSDAMGAFVGKVRKAYEEKLAEIMQSCFELDVFQSDYGRKVIQYIANRYGDSPEFLWKRFPENAIFRRQDNAKWYAALLIVSKSKLGMSEKGKVDILDLRVSPNEIDALVDGKTFFPGYHMNKRNWFTICLDGSVSLEEIFARIENSYQLARKK